MSLPASIAGQAIQSMVPTSPLDSFLYIFNNNPYFIGIMMLILNLGGRFMILEVTKKQEQFLQHPWVRRVLIFVVLFVGTRNLWVAFWATVFVVLFLGYLFNENSALCLFGEGGSTGSTCSSPNQSLEEMTPEEKDILQRLSAKAMRYQNSDNHSKKNKGKSPDQIALGNSIKTSSTSTIEQGMPDEEDDVLLSDIYSANLTLLRN
jgi:hypothetical protein